MRSAKILIIDDEPALRESMADYLEDEGYETKTAANGEDGLAYLSGWGAEMAIVDLNMPVLDGYGFIKIALEKWPDLPIVVVSGVGIVDRAVEAMRLGAVDYLTKPISNLYLIQSSVEKALERARLVRENREYQKDLERKVDERTAEIEAVKQQLIFSLGKSAEYRDNETGSHILRVGDICEQIGRTLGLEGKVLKNLRGTAPLHDIGKIGIADRVLLKPGPLDSEERNEIETHCEIGFTILSSREDIRSRDGNSWESLIASAGSLLETDFLSMAKLVALFHHERWDGKGYPCGLAGDAIPLVARIVAVADVYDALSSERPYKDPFPEDLCQKIIREGSATQFDPEVVDAFFQNIDAIIDIKSSMRD